MDGAISICRVARGVWLQDFFAYMPLHQYLFLPTRELWPAASVECQVLPTLQRGWLARDQAHPA
jgi:hypothetical protein